MFPSKAVWEVVSKPFKRSQLGLFQGKTKSYGNNVPFSKHKTRRSWLPNVQQKRLPSEIMGENIRVKLTTRALKTIKKKGGLDNYLKTTSGELLGHKGMELRLMVRARQAENNKPKAVTLFTGGTSSASTATLATARSARAMAGWALGKKGCASAAETIAYLNGSSSASSRKVQKGGRHGPHTPRLLRLVAPRSTSLALTPVVN